MAILDCRQTDYVSSIHRRVRSAHVPFRSRRIRKGKIIVSYNLILIGNNRNPTIPNLVLTSSWGRVSPNNPEQPNPALCAPMPQAAHGCCGSCPPDGFIFIGSAIKSHDGCDVLMVN